MARALWGARRAHAVVLWTQAEGGQQQLAQLEETCVTVRARSRELDALVDRDAAFHQHEHAVGQADRLVDAVRDEQYRWPVAGAHSRSSACIRKRVSASSAPNGSSASKGRLGKYGRRPDELKIMPGVSPDLDGPPPKFRESTNGSLSRLKLVADLAARENLTLRQLYQRLAGARGHWVLVGTPESIADELQRWFENEAADGFNIMPPILPESLHTVVELLVPELQRRGLFRTAYEGTTLRENLGLARPQSRYTSTPAEVAGRVRAAE